MTSPHEKVIFLHIPKTGGLSVNLVLTRQFIGRRGYTVHRNIAESVEKLVALPQPERDAIDYISGHVRYGIHEIWTASANYFTMLREPIARAVSGYVFLGVTARGKANPELRGDFETFMKSPTRANYNVARLAGYPPGQPGVNLTEAEAATPEALALAEANLRKMRVVGLTEQFDVTMLLLRRAYGWRNVYYVRQNTTAKRKKSKQETVSPELRQELTRLYAHDLALYETARSLFEEQCRAYGDTLEADLALYRRNNATYGRLFEATQRLRGSSVYRLVRRLTGGILR